MNPNAEIPGRLKFTPWTLCSPEFETFRFSRQHRNAPCLHLRGGYFVVKGNLDRLTTVGVKLSPTLFFLCDLLNQLTEPRNYCFKQKSYLGSFMGVIWAFVSASSKAENLSSVNNKNSWFNGADNFPRFCFSAKLFRSLPELHVWGISWEKSLLKAYEDAFRELRKVNLN